MINPAQQIAGFTTYFLITGLATLHDFLYSDRLSPSVTVFNNLLSLPCIFCFDMHVSALVMHLLHSPWTFSFCHSPSAVDADASAFAKVV